MTYAITVFSIKSSINKLKTLRKYGKVEGPWGQTAEPSPPNLNGYIAEASQEGKNNSSPAMSGHVMSCSIMLLQLTFILSSLVHKSQIFTQRLPRAAGAKPQHPFYKIRWYEEGRQKKAGREIHVM